jgi:hypothetical protein
LLILGIIVYANRVLWDNGTCVHNDGETRSEKALPLFWGDSGAFFVGDARFRFIEDAVSEKIANCAVKTL